MIRDSYEACSRSGMPIKHARCFQRVADLLQCVIASRSVGRYATGLIMEGYASKGFHVKAKSCNWGPMAGFVLADPRFTKRGGSIEARGSQRKDVHTALYRYHAGQIQVFISENRRKELEQMHCMTRIGGKINAMRYSAVSPDGARMEFVLKRTMNAPGACGQQLWGVFYGANEVALPSAPDQPTSATGDDLLPVLALVDPMCSPSLTGLYRSAMTGDYDLWAVFPRATVYSPTDADRRPVPRSNRHVVSIREFIRHEDPHMGNITQRIAITVKSALNLAIQRAGYTGGDMVHHSDEAGRPLVSEVELEFIAFIPGQRDAVFIESLDDLKEFFDNVIREYHITFNPGWQVQLGFSATPQGNWEI
ncbi:Calmodulin-sensitive adenylate cyclase [BD1-7 clade bacterium]|uniref:Calmodulin-sensitive adenylate cyclase n=1 Tax=BD1-7 clade bacterium TaxID=2029982 RepID=A0A5S9PKA6_9GAMM|nr:Calmodulin-sensitive adenylate cyclase [BD1-7 clade bacterium]CAA0104525.1 Calmodulin-sensitive adenylate cyclase [BD1-7 clade bacterium]